MRLLRMMVLFLSGSMLMPVQASRVYDLMLSPLNPHETRQERNGRIAQAMCYKHHDLEEHSKALTELANSAEIMGILQHSKRLKSFSYSLYSSALKYGARAKELQKRIPIFQVVCQSTNPAIWHGYAEQYKGTYRTQTSVWWNWKEASDYAQKKLQDHYDLWSQLNVLKRYFPSQSDGAIICERALSFELGYHSKWYYKYSHATSMLYYAHFSRQGGQYYWPVTSDQRIGTVSSGPVLASSSSETEDLDKS